MNRRLYLASSAGLAVATLAGLQALRFSFRAQAAPATVYAVAYPDAEWRRRLSPAAYDVLRQAGTEAPFTSSLLHEARAGIFHCDGCTLALYSSKTKYDSGTGWPSFWDHLPQAIATSDDNRFGMGRTEVHCRQCGGHLGHVFADGPRPTGLRYCMNGAAMRFSPGPV